MLVPSELSLPGDNYSDYDVACGNRASTTVGTGLLTQHN
jgi:hypothetical protein